MAVYVDSNRVRFGRMIMCHLWADSVDELLAMVDRIGVQRKWIQGHPELSFGKHKLAQWVHFDISLAKRELAIECGAIATDRYGASYHVAKLRGNVAMIETIEKLRERKSPQPVKARGSKYAERNG